MKVVKKDQAEDFSNSETCWGFEYSFNDKDLNIAYVTVNGRYPDKGHLMNKVCKETAYVLSGSGVLGVDDKKFVLLPGDSLLIDPGERFYWKADNLVLVITCTPSFYPKQHVLVD